MRAHAAADRPGQERARSQAEEDVRLINRIRHHDLDAFETLYRDYQPRLARFLANLVRRPQLIEEVLDDTLLVVWGRPDSFNGNSKLSTWIFAIAYRKAMKALQRQDEPVEDRDAETRVSPNPGPDEEANRQWLKTALVEAIGQLSADHRTVIDLTYFHEIGYREIAEIMQCPVDTVKTRMFHARRYLKRTLAGEFADWL